jgi:hypothetical protein
LVSVLQTKKQTQMKKRQIILRDQTAQVCSSLRAL